MFNAMFFGKPQDIEGYTRSTYVILAGGNYHMWCELGLVLE